MRGSHNERQKEEQQHLCWQQGKKNQEIEKSPFGGAGVPAGGMQLIAQKQEPRRRNASLLLLTAHTGERHWNVVTGVPIEQPASLVRQVSSLRSNLPACLFYCPASNQGQDLGFFRTMLL